MPLFGKPKQPYEKIMEDIESELNAASYDTAKILGPKETADFEKKFSDFVYNVLMRAGGDKSVYGEVPLEYLSEMTDRICKPIASDLLWPVIGNPSDKKYIKVSPIVALAHGVYELKGKKVMSPLVIQNPESPYGYVELKAELFDGGDSGILSEMPSKYIRVIWGRAAAKDAVKETQRKFVLKPASEMLLPPPKMLHLKANLPKPKSNKAGSAFDTKLSKQLIGELLHTGDHVPE